MIPSFFCIALLIAQPADDLTALINRELAQQWQAQKFTPSERAADLQFLRRAALDLIGRIPTRGEQAVYLKDPPQTRRKRVIDRLLDHDDYARHWANVWTDRLLGPAAESSGRKDFHGWLQKHFARNGSHKELAEKLLTATGSTSDNPALHLLLAHRGQKIAEKDWQDLGQYDMVPLTGHVARVLHGRRLHCVQCHDHPFSDEMHQADFHQTNLFFRQVRFTAKPAVDRNKKSIIDISDDPELNKKGMLPFERRNSVVLFTVPKFGKDQWKPGMKETRREFLAERFTKHPHFAQAFVNFTWARLFGHGLMQGAYDDMGAGNDVLHAKIMERLTTEFVKGDHSPKAILRRLCNSDAYALSSVANKSNAGPENRGYFARMEVRPLVHRQLLESVIVALTLEDYVMRRDGLREEMLREHPPTPPAETHHCEAIPLDSEGEFSIRQALWLMNGDVVGREINDAKGTVGKLMKAHGMNEKALPAVVTELFLITLCREPTPQELQRLTDRKIYSARNPGQEPTQALLTSYCRDLLWALVNSNEFGTNH